MSARKKLVLVQPESVVNAQTWPHAELISHITIREWTATQFWGAAAAMLSVRSSLRLCVIVLVCVLTLFSLSLVGLLIFVWCHNRATIVLLLRSLFCVVEFFSLFSTLWVLPDQKVAITESPCQGSMGVLVARCSRVPCKENYLHFWSNWVAQLSSG